MGEIKGQLLTVLLVVVVFAAIGGALYTAFNSTKDKITSYASSESTSITSKTTSTTSDFEKNYGDLQGFQSK